MTSGDLSIANGVMKIVGGKLTKQYEESKLLHNRFNKGKGTKISDRGVEIPTHLSGNYNHRFMTDGGDFPAGGSNLAKRANVFFKNYALACRLTGGAIDAVNSMDVAYVKDVLQWNLDESVSAGYKTCNWYAWGTGTGRLATISAGAASVTQTVNNNDANRFLRDDMVVDSVIPATGVLGISNTRISVAKATATTFTLAATGTSNTGDFIVTAGSFNLAFTGIAAIIDDTTNAQTTFQALSRNTFLSYRAFRVAAGSVGLDVSFMRRALGAGVYINVGELNREALEVWSHPAQTAAYSALGWNLKRAQMNEKKIDLGYTTYEYEGINWVEDVDAPKDRVYFIDWSTMNKYVAKDYGWDDKTGSILRQVPSTTSGIAYTDQYEAYWTARHNYGCTRPNTNAWIDSLAVPTGF